MGPSILFCLLSICVQLKLHLCKQICESNQYTIFWSNGSIKNCLNCDICHAGYGLYPVCGSHIVFPPKGIGCKACPSGQFSDKDDSAPCQNCQECVKHEIIASNCTRSSDRNCSGTCFKGYYFAKKAPHNCQQCWHCCNDGNDEIQPECINQGLNATDQHCSRRPDKTCGPEPTPIATVTASPIAPVASTFHVHPTNSSAWHHDQSPNHGNSTIIMVLGILVGLLFAALLVGAVLYLRRKGWTTSKRRDERHSHSNNETERNLSETAGCQSPANQVDLSQVHVDVRQELAHITRFHAVHENAGFSSNSNPVTPKASPGGTPCHTDDELDPLPDVIMRGKQKRVVKRQKSQEAPNDSTSESLLDTVVQTSGRKDSIGNKNVEGQEDIKGAGSGGERKRSRSGSLLGILRKLSLPSSYQPLDREDPDKGKQAPNDSTSESLLDTVVQTSGRKDSIGNKNVEGQEDIKGAGSGGERKRSRSGSLLGVMRKLSLPSSYQPLDRKDPDEGKLESLRIVEQPTHQTLVEEGSRVELRCKAQGKKTLSYQWLKDGTKMQGEHSRTESLVFDSVKVRDFGWYTCEVRCADDQNRPECVESSPAELDVHPPDGKRFKYLDEAFQQSLDTREKVEKLLVKEIPGSGGWKNVASKWKMPGIDIEFLERTHEEGKGVISYLKARYPTLTVYDFCKFLKEIKRIDIIEEVFIKEHLVSVPKEQTV